MKINYTPGPWKYRPVPNDMPDNSRKFWIDHSDGGPVADVFNRGEDALGNARLIAKAPELVEMLKRLVSLHDETPSMLTTEDWDDAHKLIKELEV